jgi:hypothetical protein
MNVPNHSQRLEEIGTQSLSRTVLARSERETRRRATWFVIIGASLALLMTVSAESLWLNASDGLADIGDGILSTACRLLAFCLAIVVAVVADRHKAQLSRSLLRLSVVPAVGVRLDLVFVWFFGLPR